MKENAWMTIVAILVILILVLGFVAFKDKLNINKKAVNESVSDNVAADPKISALTDDFASDEISDSPTIPDLDLPEST
jgi:hypothetical protein